MKKLSTVVGVLLVAGCSSNPRMGDGDLKPVPVSPEQRLAQARAGEAVVFEGYVYNGVIVTPARNYYYGQTNGWSGPEMVQGDCFISEESARAGGEITPECESAVNAVMPEAPVSQMAPVAIAPVPVERPAPPPMPSDVNPFYADLLAETMKLDPGSQSDLLDRTLSFAHAPTPRFKAGSAAVSTADRQRLEVFAGDIKRLGESVIVLIAGYTSSEGPKDLNDMLARRRAQAVREILVNEGVRSDFMIAFAAPQCCYLNSNRTASERSVNRRVELQQGGRYADAGDLTPKDIALAISRMRKHMSGQPGTVRIHVQAGSPELGRRLMADVRSVMNRPEVGFRSIEEGVVSVGGPANVIIEVKS